MSFAHTSNADGNKFEPSAGEKDQYHYCELAGLAKGSNRKFIGAIAEELIMVKYGGVNNDCSDEWQKAYKDMQAAQNNYKDTYSQRELSFKIQNLNQK